jgi:hypothetical protein
MRLIAAGPSRCRLTLITVKPKPSACGLLVSRGTGGPGHERPLANHSESGHSPPDAQADCRSSGLRTPMPGFFMTCV